MPSSVVKLASDLIAIPSVSCDSNVQVSDLIQQFLETNGFETERLTYRDTNGVDKVNVVGRKGLGTGGLGFFAHSDTVPGGEGWNPTSPEIKNGRLIGRGACDMKGPIASALIAAAAVDERQLKKPLYLAVAADEEIDHHGAHVIIKHSAMFAKNWPDSGVVIEPTDLIPVYAHKCGSRVLVTAHGRAAHSSTDKGISANFLIAPFLSKMAELAKLFKSDERFKNHEFDPPTNGFNMIIDDFGTKINVTAPRSVAQLSVRSMTNDSHEEAIQLIVDAAHNLGLQVEQRLGKGAFYISKKAEIVQAACRAAGVEKAVTVPYGTEASDYQHHVRPVVLGPGNIDQAHTEGEWVDLQQLEDAVGIYGKIICDLCM